MANLHAKKAILEAIETQITNNEPPYMRDIFEKITKKVKDKKHAKEIMAGVLLEEMFNMTKEKRLFDVQLYEENLYKAYDNVEKIDNIDIIKEKELIYEIKVHLIGYDKKLYRTVLVPAKFTVSELAYVIISVMNTEAYHLYNIVYNDVVYDCNVCPEENYSKRETKNACEIKLFDLNLVLGSTMIMTYDFGEDWKFEINIKNILPQDKNIKYPLVVNGKGYGILEDDRHVFEEMIKGTYVFSEADYDLIYFDIDLDYFNLRECQNQLKKNFKNIKYEYENNSFF